MNTFAYLCGMKKELKEFFANKEAIGEMIRFAGFIFNYYMSAYYIFRKKTSAKNGAGFSLAHIVNYLLQMVLLNFFIWIGMSAELAPVGVYAVSIPVNFLLVRFVFKKM